jgi:hypothetical protein
MKNPEQPTSNKESSYVDHTYELASRHAKETFLQNREKHLGFSSLRGDGAFVLSCPHAMSWIEKTDNIVSEEDVAEMNENDRHENRKRYSRSSKGNLLIGKQFVHAQERPNRSGFVADPNTGALAIETFAQTEEHRPSAVIMEMPQVYFEPNKTDINNANMPVVSMGIFNRIGATDFINYIKKNTVSPFTSHEVILVKRGDYSKSEVADDEEDQEKKSALISLEKAISSQKDDQEIYREALSTLSILRIHREFYEEQERILYQEHPSRFPVNLDLHTCFDRRRTIEQTDVIIGTQFGQSVTDPEMEYLLALAFQKKGFRTSISTLNTIPQTEAGFDSLKVFIDKSLEIPRLASEESSEKIEVILENYTKEQVEKDLLTIATQRVERHITKERGVDALKLFLKTKGRADKELAKMKPNEITASVKDYYKNLCQTMDLKKLRIILAQTILNEDLVQSGIQLDRFSGGLTGLSSLQAKHNAAEKYENNAIEMRPTIAQIEIASSLLKNNESQHHISETILYLSEETQKNNFSPQEELQTALNYLARTS